MVDLNGELVVGDQLPGLCHKHQEPGAARPLVHRSCTVYILRMAGVSR